MSHLTCANCKKQFDIIVERYDKLDWYHGRLTDHTFEIVGQEMPYAIIILYSEYPVIDKYCIVRNDSTICGFCSESCIKTDASVNIINSGIRKKRFGIDLYKLDDPDVDLKWGCGSKSIDLYELFDMVGIELIRKQTNLNISNQYI